jgi:hypothetical protein
MILSAKRLLAAALVAVLGATGCGEGRFDAPSSPSGSSVISGATIVGVLHGAGATANLSAMSTGWTAAAESSTITVTLLGTNITVTVDSSGRFSFTNVPAGDIRLFFRGPNVSAVITVTNVGQLERVDLQLTVTGTDVTVVNETRSVGKVELCHRTGEGEYHTIEVDGSAESAHRAHGDGKVGERVPGAPTRVFDSSCRSVNFGVAIRKLTNGEDANSAPGPSVTIGAPIAWEYIVTNTGTAPLTGIAVTDDKGVTVNCNAQTALAVGASMTCTGTGVAVAGQYRNVGAVTANAGATRYTDSDPSHYFGRAPSSDDGPKVQLCHRTGNGSYHLIEVSVNAEPAHRAHGDGKIGEAVPGSAGRTFGPACSIR